MDLSKFLDEDGDLEFPNLLYNVFHRLMKDTLDLGTMVCTDDRKLRAFKETVKRNFKTKWSDIAEALIKAEMIVPCTCTERDYCQICGGSRFVINDIYKLDVVIESETVIAKGAEAKAGKLRLEK